MLEWRRTGGVLPVPITTCAGTDNTMQPTGPQTKRLQQALLSAYPSEITLRQMVRIHLDASLDAVVPLHRQNQTDIVFDLIERYAEKAGGLHALIKAAVAGNPGNRLLAAVAAELLAIDFDPLPVRPDRRQILWINVPPKPAVPLLGRDALLSDLIARLSAGHSPAISTDGLPGVGKTALAVALAHDARVRSVLPDGVLWGGLGVNPDVVTVQNQWAAALGVDLADEQDVYRRRERLSTVLGDRPVLVVLDDAWENEAAQTLRLSSMYAVHLLTTRNRAIARAFAGAQQQVHVPELDPDPAYELLERPAPEACAADPAAARRLVQTVGELPLAIEVLGGYLAGHDLTVFPDLAKDAFEALEDTKRRLAIATDRLGGQPGKRQTLEAAIRLSVEALPPKVATAFWSLGAFAPKPATFDRAAAQAVTQAEPGTLALLVGRNLVDAANGVLAVHQVVHDVMARALPGKAVEEHRGYYLGLVHEDREDWQRIEAVYAQVRFAWQQLVEDGKLSPRLFQFVGQLGAYQERRGIWQDKLAWCHQALAYAQTEMLVKEQASLLVHLGYGYSALGDKLQALDYYVQSLPLRRQVGDKTGEATTLINIGAVYSALGDKHQALDYFEQAHSLSRQVGDRIREATTLNNIGQVYSALGDIRQAFDYFERALPLFRQVGDNAGEATILNNMAILCFQRGEVAKAAAYFRQVITIFHKIGAVAEEAAVLSNLAQLLQVTKGDIAEAASLMHQSIHLLDRAGLRQDANGQTINHKRALLAELFGKPPPP